jgi:hypothetical protein
LYNLLRERHDEDWFRNPRAGATLRAVLDELRTRGVIAWAGGDGQNAAAVALDSAPLARWTSEALREARH